MKTKAVALVLLAAMLLAACGGTPAVSSPATSPASTEASKPAEASSANFSTVYSSELSTICYLWSQASGEQAPGANCVSGLVQNDEYGNIIYDLAVSHTKSDDGLVYTFKIREGVMWYDYEGNEYDETTAEDFVAAAKYVMNAANGSKTANLYYDIIKNGREYFEGTITDFEEVGVKALDKYTIEYTLSRPAPYFISMLTYTVFYPASVKLMEEVGHENFALDHKSFMNNGAYILQTFESQVERVFVANPNYYDADQVYVKQLNYIYNKEASNLAPEMFLRGDISTATIPIAMIDSWVNDPERKNMVRPSWGMLYNAFYFLNFWPNADLMDAKYEPENWGLAVNNLDFRKAIFHGLNRRELAMIAEPFDPDSILTRTVTPPLFSSVGETDYTMLGDLKAISETDPYDVEKAREYAEKAMEELAGAVTFPVICFYPYSSASQDAANLAQTMEQTLEKNLGSDFIDVQIEAYPPTGFADATQRSGNFSIMTYTWGADYLDPESYSDPLLPQKGSLCVNHSYNMTDPAAETYLAMLNEAKAEFLDIAKRYELFANAEAYMIDQCLAMPWRYSRSYVASNLVPFTGQWANCGMGNEKFKGRIYADRTYGTEEFNEMHATWLKEREASLSNPRNLQ